MTKTRVLILGAAGKDFHVFNSIYRDNDDYEVVAFTATQILGIEDRLYPPELSGNLYPEGIPILDESNLVSIINEYNVDTCVFAYSDVEHKTVMNLASIANAAGADFMLHSMDKTMLQTDKPVISINAVRTGVGKSQTSRYVTKVLKDLGKQVVAIRHPMPYGDLAKQMVQRFASYDDLDTHECTIEEREEYEPYIDQGFVIYAGVDYEKILREAEKEAEVIIWDGGNNDTPFIQPDLHICLADPHRPNHELTYHPGETNFRSASMIIINKVDSATEDNIAIVEKNASRANPSAKVIKTKSPVTTENPDMVKGKRVLVLEDGPTITHGSLSTGAGMIAAKQLDCEVVDPKPHVIGTVKEAFDNYSQLDMALPALGYSDQQLREMEQIIDAVDCDVVLSGTPIDITRVLNVSKPIVRVRYALEETGGSPLADAVKEVVS